MNSEQYLSDIYKDFFGEYEKRKENNEEVINVDYEEEINKLLISDESKELNLKKNLNLLNKNLKINYLKSILKKRNKILFFIC